MLPDGLRLGHLAVLGALADEAPRTQRMLAGTLKIHPSDVVAIVDELVMRDLASRETDPADRRRNLIQPTPAGLRLVEQSTRDSQRISRELLGALSADERKAVELLLRRALVEAGPASAARPGTPDGLRSDHRLPRAAGPQLPTGGSSQQGVDVGGDGDRADEAVVLRGRGVDGRPGVPEPVQQRGGDGDGQGVRAGP